MKRIAVALLAALAGAGAAVLTAQPAERVDSAMVAKIRDEGLKGSQVHTVFSQFVDVIGPRLTASPGHKRAAEFARDELARWGLTNARLEPFEFGRGWVLEKFTLEMVEPRYMPLVGYPEAWSPGTPGEIVASVVSLAGKSPEAVKELQASLKGAAVMQQPLVANFIRADRVQPTDPNQVVLRPGNAMLTSGSAMVPHGQVRPLPGPGMPMTISSVEEGQLALASHGIKWQRLERVENGEWQVTCGLSHSPDALGYKQYGARHPDPVGAVRAVLQQVQQDR